MKKTEYCSIILFLLAFTSIVGQEHEYPLTFNPVQAKMAAMERMYPQRSVERTSLALPFFDDFSRFSFPTSNPAIPTEWQRWEPNSSFLNNDFPDNPYTVGVATLDGLDDTGYPYDFLNEFTYGPADTLTSLPINLGGLNEEDNVYLSFFYQAKGLGNAPDDNDSLLVEFYAPGTDVWIKKWAIPGQDLSPFQQVFIPITEPFFLVDNFKFRFRNYATLSGNVDHWHLDYVRLAEQVDPANYPTPDVAFLYDVNTLLTPYSAMPWTHFLSNPSAFMAPNVDFHLTNRSQSAQNVPTSYQIKYEDQNWNYANVDVNPALFPGEYTGNASILDSPSNFVFDTSVNDTCAIFDVCFYINNQDAFPMNDTIRFQQRFLDYYAYDDGTAELAYGLSSAGAQLAVKYNSVIPDTLVGLMIYFNPFLDDVSDLTFVLRAWTDNNGSPGNELGINFIQHQPNYLQDGHNAFAYFAYDQPLAVSGSFFVGLVQNNANKLNIGNDKNGTTNLSTVKYRLATSGEWSNTTISGSLMIRPVFKAGKSTISQVEENAPFEGLLYPNPFRDAFTITGLKSDDTLEILDISGKTVYRSKPETSQQSVTTTALSDGVYMVRIIHSDGTAHMAKVIKD